MDKDLHYESNATLLSTLLNIPAEDLTCKNISDLLTSPLSIKGIGNKKASKLYAVKEVVRRIMEEKPSGDPTPSREDIAVTERLVKAGKVMDIPNLDHIIIGQHNYVSLKEKNIIL